MPDFKIRQLDEIFARSTDKTCYVHLERMSDSHVWLCIHYHGVDFHVNLMTKRAPITVTIEEDV